jgi:hypothetical protein
MGKIDGRIELDEVLLKAKLNTQNFINHLEQEELGERIETIDSLQNQMRADRTNTNRKKLQFIDEIKSDLGKEIKEKGARGITIKKLTFSEKIKRFFRGIYSKF